MQCGSPASVRSSGFVEAANRPYLGDGGGFSSQPLPTKTVIESEREVRPLLFAADGTPLVLPSRSIGFVRGNP